jgi:predicted nuclease of predicted toxin-antitoxin system
VLIDGDNAQPRAIDGLLADIARFGVATVKRIYGDFTSPGNARWKETLHKQAIKPVQQFAYTSGKNATDITLVIDAMDLLYTRRFDGFCLVSSDSDFTGLALRIREEGLLVLGVGERKTPEAFRTACHRFLLTDAELTPAALSSKCASPTISTSPAVPRQEPPPASNGKMPKQALPKAALLQALTQACDDSGWAHLGNFGSYLGKLQPGFDSRHYGFSKLSNLVKGKPDLFLIREAPADAKGQKQIYLRAR